MIGGLVELVTDPFGHPVFIEEVDRLADQIVEIDSPGQALRLAIGPRISSACGKRLCIKVSPEDARAQFKEIVRSEEHTSELQSLMRISYAVFCLKKKTTERKQDAHTHEAV